MSVSQKIVEGKPRARPEKAVPSITGKEDRDPGPKP